MVGDYSSAPQLTQVVSPRERRAAGATSAYADTLNQSYLAQYNNEYNYWLWQQQMEYNSPAEQRKRLEEAGLNPNFNSIEGTGNSSSIPTASITQAGKVDNSANGFSKTLQVLQLANSMSSAVKNLVGSVSTYSGIPNDIQGARSIVYDILKNNRDLGISNIDGKKIANSINRILANWDEYLYYGVDQVGETSLVGNSPMAENFAKRNEALNVLNSLRRAQTGVANYKLDYLDPLTKEWLQGRNNLQDIDLDWREFEKNLGAGSGVLKILLSFLQTLIR